MSSANKIVRIHAPFVSETEIEKVNNYLRSQAEPDYIDEILNFADEKEINNIVKEVINDDYRFRTVIEQIVLSPSFYKKEQNWFNKLVGR
jgi:S-DNA-T family DNA segregation ATPase FtsK/SpoIIIE